MSLAADLARSLDPLAVATSAGIEPDLWQAEIIESSHPRIILNMSRQIGKTTTTAMVAVRSALEDPGLILCTAPSQRQSSELFRKITETLLGQKPAPKFSMESASRLELANGSRIVALPGTEATVRGYSAPKLVLLDEASRIPDDFYAAVRPMLAAGGGRLIALSTPWGRRGWFFNAWQYGGDTWQRYRVPATECPRISAEFLAEELRELGPLRYAAEYCCEFVDTDEQFFPTKLIEAALTDDLEPIWGPA